MPVPLISVDDLPYKDISGLTEILLNLQSTSVDMNQHPVTIIAPCYNEGLIIDSFLNRLQDTLSVLPCHFNVVMVNDGSTDTTSAMLAGFEFKASNLSLEVINLVHNSGHQAAIYKGFIHAAAGNCSHVIVMDADGEDSPEVIKQLLDHSDADVVHVIRGRRRESVLFRLGYYCYKMLFRAVTGKQMNFGNFCMIKREVMEVAIASRFTHLAAFLSRQARNTTYVLAERGTRLGGSSKMSFRKLVQHAASSFAEYGYEKQIRFFRKVIFK